MIQFSLFSFIAGMVVMLLGRTIFDAFMRMPESVESPSPRDAGGNFVDTHPLSRKPIPPPPSTGMDLSAPAPQRPPRKRNATAAATPGRPAGKR